MLLVCYTSVDWNHITYVHPRPQNGDRYVVLAFAKCRLQHLSWGYPVAAFGKIYELCRLISFHSHNQPVF